MDFKREKQAQQFWIHTISKMGLKQVDNARLADEITFNRFPDVDLFRRPWTGSHDHPIPCETILVMRKPDYLKGENK